MGITLEYETSVASEVIGPEFRHPSGREELQNHPVVIDVVDRKYFFTPPEQLIRDNIHIRRNEVILLSDIISDDGPTAEGKIQEIVESIHNNEGQREFISVASRLNEEGKIVYYITNGYHRVNAFKAMGFTHVDATVQYAHTDEEILDLRVKAARDENSIRFTRVATWMTQSFELSEWFARGMTLKQVIMIAVGDSTKGRGLDEEETIRLKDWIQTKAKSWRMSFQSIQKIITVAADTSPEIIAIVKETGGGRIGRGVINPSRLIELVSVLPGQIDLQWKVIEEVRKHNFDAKRVRILATGLASATTLEEQERILADSKAYVQREWIQQKDNPKDPTGVVGSEMKKESDVYAIFEEERNDLETKIRLLSEQLQKATDDAIAQHQTDQQIITTLRTQNGTGTPIATNGVIYSVEGGELDEDNLVIATLIRLTEDIKQPWCKIPELNFLERFISAYFSAPNFKKVFPLRKLSDWFGLTEEQIHARYRSAVAKATIWEQEQRTFVGL